jgi:hypothetical protein
MVLICNICNQNIENNSYHIFDKIHCSIKCKNTYKQIMEEKKLEQNELYYEKNYLNINKKNNTFPIFFNNNNMRIRKKSDYHKLISCPNYIEIKENNYSYKNIDNLKEVVIHNPILMEENNKSEKKGYSVFFKEMLLECIKYFME